MNNKQTVDIAGLERVLGYTFRDKTLLSMAVTHASYTNVSGEEGYDRLEFLGDSLVDFVASDMLYAEHPSAKEGELTELRKQYVSKEALTPVSERLGLVSFARYIGELGKKAPSDLFESVTAAIYLDGGIGAARSFLARNLAFKEIIDYKTRLKEFVEKKGATVEAEFAGENKNVCTMSALGRVVTCEGENKSAAETAAAKRLYEELKGKNGNEL